MMTTIKFLLCLLVITTISCSTDNATETATPLNKQNINVVRDPRDSSVLLKGTWTWTQTTGGFAGVNETPASTGTTREVVFYGNNFYRFSVNGVTTSQGTYTIVQALCFHTQTLKPTIHFTNAFIMDLMVENISTSSLELSEEVGDGFLYSYIKN